MQYLNNVNVIKDKKAFGLFETSYVRFLVFG